MEQHRTIIKHQNQTPPQIHQINQQLLTQQFILEIKNNIIYSIAKNAVEQFISNDKLYARIRLYV